MNRAAQEGLLHDLGDPRGGRDSTGEKVRAIRRQVLEGIDPALPVAARAHGADRRAAAPGARKARKVTIE